MPFVSGMEREEESVDNILFYRILILKNIL
jgi:hypothetical protein